MRQLLLSPPSGAVAVAAATAVVVAVVPSTDIRALAVAAVVVVVAVVVVEVVVVVVVGTSTVSFTIVGGRMLDGSLVCTMELRVTSSRGGSPCCAFAPIREAYATSQLPATSTSRPPNAPELRVRAIASANCACSCASACCPRLSGGAGAGAGAAELGGFGGWAAAGATVGAVLAMIVDGMKQLFST